MTTRKQAPRAVQDGLSTTSSYVILARNGRMGVHLALRPFVQRLNEHVVLLGGRLRIAFDFVARGEVVRQAKFASFDEDEVAKILKEEFPGFKWETKSTKRLSTTVGIMIAAGQGDGDDFKEQWDDTDFISPLLVEIGEKTSQPITGCKGLEKAKTICMEELTKRYENSMGHLFMEGGVKLDPDTLGEISELVNLTNHRGYKSTLEAFSKKVGRHTQAA